MGVFTKTSAPRTMGRPLYVVTFVARGEEHFELIESADDAFTLAHLYMSVPFQSVSIWSQEGHIGHWSRILWAPNTVMGPRTSFDLKTVRECSRHWVCARYDWADASALLERVHSFQEWDYYGIQKCEMWLDPSTVAWSWVAYVSLTFAESVRRGRVWCALDAMLDLPDEPWELFCSTDYMQNYAAQRARERGGVSFFSWEVGRDA